MGILITQKGKEWNLGIRETWIFKNKEEGLKIMGYLIDKKIEHGVRTLKGYGLIDMNNSEISVEDMEEFKSILQKLLEFKEKYGQVIQREGGNEKWK